MKNFSIVDRSPPSKSLDDFIGNFRGSSVESEGEFTLDPKRARELLRTFQLDNPHRYVLHLVSFLVGLYPKNIEVQIEVAEGEHRVTLRAHKTDLAPSVELDPKHIANPFVGLLRRGQDRHFEELAIGLNAAMGIPDCVVTIRSGTSLGAYTGEQITVEDDVDEYAGIRFEIRRPYSRKANKDVAQEEELLHHNFPHSPVPVVVNGLEVSTHLPCNPADLEWHLHNPYDPVWLMENEYRFTEPHTARFSALVQVGDVTPGLELIHLGRSYLKKVPWELAGSGYRVRITVASTRCKKDLSQLEILEEKVFQNLVNHIRQRFLNAMASFLKPLPEGPSPPSEFMDLMIDHAYRGGAKEQAYQIQRRQYQRSQATRALLRKATASYRLGLMEKARGGTQAETLMQEGERNFQEWKAPRDLFYEEYPVAPKVYTAWVKVRAHYYLGEHNQELADMLFTQAQVARGCLPIEATCFNWAMDIDPGRGRIQERLRWGQVLHRLKRLEEAKKVLNDAQGRLGPEGVEAVTGWQVTELLGQVCAEMGDHKEGIKYLSSVLEDKRDKHGNNSTILGITLERLIVILDHTGDSETANHYRSWVARLEAR